MRIFIFNRYIDFRDPDGTLKKFYWHLVTLKLAFVIMFEVSDTSFSLWFLLHFKLTSRWFFGVVSQKVTVHIPNPTK